MRDIILTQVGKDPKTGDIEIEYEYASDTNIPPHKRKRYEIRIPAKDAYVLGTAIKSDGYNIKADASETKAEEIAIERSNSGLCDRKDEDGFMVSVKEMKD